MNEFILQLLLLGATAYAIWRATRPNMTTGITYTSNINGVDGERGPEAVLSRRDSYVEQNAPAISPIDIEQILMQQWTNEYPNAAIRLTAFESDTDYVNSVDPLPKTTVRATVKINAQLYNLYVYGYSELTTAYVDQLRFQLRNIMREETPKRLKQWLDAGLEGDEE